MVGVDLQDSEENHALVEAIEDDNPEADTDPDARPGEAADDRANW